jgi:hypothetical protein
MKRRLIVACTILIALTLATGCALTDATLKLRCDAPAPTAKVESLPAISIAKWTDARKVDDPKFVYYKNNNFGKTMGKLLSEDVTIVDFTTEVVRRIVQQAGIEIVDNGELVLSGKILAMDSVAKMGFWSGTVDSVMHGEVQLTKGGQMVSKDSFVEKGTSEKLQVVTVADYEDSLEKLFRNLSITIIDFIKSSLVQK